MSQDPFADIGTGSFDTVEDRRQAAMNYFQEQGYQPFQAAAIVGNLMHESGMDTAAKGDGGASVGLAQWNKERRGALKKFAAVNRLDPENFMTQLRFVEHELNAGENEAAQALRQTKNLDEATKVFSKEYERPGKPMMQSRINHAATALTEGGNPFADIGGSATTPAATIQSPENPEAVSGPQTTPADLTERQSPTIYDTLKKIFTGGSLEQGKKNLQRWFVEPNGVQNFNQDVSAALQSPEALAFAALDPMLAVTTQVSKGALAGKIPIKEPNPQVSALEKVVGMEKFNPGEMEQLMALAKEKYGIDLTVPELTNSPTLRAHWVALAKTPGTPAERLAEFIQKVRQPQIEAAISQELGKVSPVAVTSYQAGGQARSAAQNIEANLQATRKAATQPLYKKAYENANPVDVAPVTENINELLAGTPKGSSREVALNKITGMIEDAGGDLQKLHGVKEEIDRMLEAAKADKSIDNDTRRLLTQVKAKLNGQMWESNPIYGQAQQLFRKLSEPLTEFRFGRKDLGPRYTKVKTLMARMADLSEQRLDEVPSMVFREPPEVIAKTKSYFDKEYPGTWDALVRAKLQEELDKAKDTVVNRVGNKGLDWKRRILNTPGDAKKWVAALGAKKFNQLQQFMDLLDVTSRIVYTNSETAFMLEAQAQQRAGGAQEFIQRMPETPGGAVKKTLQWAAGIFDRMKDANFQALLTDAMLDPQNAIEVSRLRRLPNSRQKVIDTAQFLENSIFRGTTATKGSEK